MKTILNADFFPPPRDDYQLVIAQLSQLQGEQYEEAKRAFARLTHCKWTTVDKCVEAFKQHQGKVSSYEI